MNRNKSVKRTIVLWLIVLLALAALVVFVFIPIYSENEVASGREPHLIFYEGDGKPLTIESDQLLLEMDGNTTQFTITHKTTGKVWTSNPVDRADDPIARGVNSDLLSSTLNLTYTNSGGETELNNYRYSMVNQNFQITRTDDSTIRIDYAIGKIERVYRIPTAITEEHYKEITDRMSKSDKKKVSTYYTLMNEKKLKEADNLEELYEMYPGLAEQSLYILKADTTTQNKEKIEGYFANAGYTEEEYELDEQNVAMKSSNSGPFFNASVTYHLEGSDFIVEVPYDSITYDAAYPLTSISVLPMFGAAGTDADGFILIPEGSGGIIRYNNGKLSQSSYYANFYGWDYGNERTEVVSETENAFGVFGMSQENGSFICMIEGASSYGGISADIAQRFNSYNTVYSKYSLIHYGRFKLSGRTNELVLMYENELASDTIVQRYRFLEGTTYVDMAEAYGDYMRETLGTEKAHSEFPVHIELVGAINKTVPRFGIPVDSVVATTTFEQGAEILEELAAAGIQNMSVQMTGWSNGGVRQKVLNRIQTLKQLGGDNGLKKLIDRANASDVHLYFDGISCFAYNSGLREGFVPFLHAARFTTRELVKLYPYDIVTYQQATWEDPYYLVKPEISAEYTDHLIDYLSARSSPGIAFRDLGNLLSADYNKDNTVTREQVKAQHIAALEKAKDLGMYVSIKEGNDYAVPYADLITDMNLTGSRYAIIDEAIPFYQIALHGLKDYTGEAINLAGDYQTAILECAEYGAGLNFTFMKADTNILQDSAYSCYTGASYDRWKDRLMEMISRYQNAMSGLNSQRITGHRYLNQEVRMTSYEDGTRVYVNYGHSDFDVDGKVIPARDYLVERGSAQ